MNASEIAQIAYEANRAYSLILGDNTKPGWDRAPEWHKDSLVAGVSFIMHDPEEYRTPANVHNRWMEQKSAEGWKYGQTYDPNKKEHPCMVPFEQLPIELQRKDKIFIAVVTACL